MRIGIDISATRIDRAGSGIYIRSLVNALRETCPTHEYRLVAFGRDQSSHHHRTVADRVENVLRDLIWTPVLLPLRAQQARLDVLHLPAHRAPLVCAVPMVVTFLDLTPLRYPETFNVWSRYYSRVTFPVIVRRAERIIAISENTKRDLEVLLGVPSEKITVIYLGSRAGLHPVQDRDTVERTLRDYGLERPFILHVGTLEPRKNIPRLLQAFSHLCAATAVAHTLVFVGRPGWQYQGIFDTIKVLGLSDKVRMVGYIPVDALACLYSAADVLAYPSLYEGFGLPVLEAMACGCPVVTSNVSSLPEVAGDAAVMVDPTDVRQLAEAIYRVISDHDLAARMRHRGVERAQLFTWERTAARTVDVYHQAAKQAAADRLERSKRNTDRD